MKHSKRLFLIVSTLVALFSSGCHPVRYIPDKTTLLKKNVIKTDTVWLEKDKLEALIKLKPNRKALGILYPYLWFYYKGSQGKENGFKLWLKEIGEEPALVDSNIVHRTRNQLNLFLNKQGFFNATVKDTIIEKDRRATVQYTIQYGTPYLIRNIQFNTKDSAISRLIPDITKNTLLHAGERYNEDVFEKEREQIAIHLKNLGYYAFTKNFITYQVDSGLESNQVDLYVYLNRINENSNPESGVRPEDHQIYSYRNIFIQTDYDPKNPAASKAKDTVQYQGYTMLSRNGERLLREKALTDCIYFKPEERYNLKEVNYSYQRMQNLNVFKYVNIGFREVERDSTQPRYLLDGFFQMSPLDRQDFTVEAEANNTGGNLGLAGSFGYRNKNLFRGAEVLEFKIRGGVQSLPNFTDSTIEKKFFFFNTYEFGPEISLSFKKFLIPGFLEGARHRRYNPKTTITSGYSLQDRPDYRRSILKVSLGYNWRTSPRKSYALVPVEINSVYVKKSPEFQAQLDSLNDPLLSYSYDTHLITALRLSYVYSGQKAESNENFFFLRTNFEMSGLLLRSLAEPLNLKTNDQGNYEFAGIQFSQYIKPDVDLSYHHVINKNNTLVYRLYSGFGVPFGNSSALPFEKSFFVGGANSMRAWIAYTLGPGNYFNTSGIEQSGDIKFEGNIEYRSFLFKFLGSSSVESALFTDIGNIWTLYEDDNRPGAKFSSGFYEDLGVGSGLGFRFNFNFFILRLDMAMKLVDPSLPKGDRWVYGDQKFVIGDITPNLAIGYPF